MRRRWTILFLLALCNKGTAKSCADSIPSFPSISSPGHIWPLQPPAPADSGYFNLGAGIEPIWAAGALQWLGQNWSGSGGWGGSALANVEARSKNHRWNLDIDARHQRIPGVTGAWHELAYNWGVFDGWGRAYTPDLQSVSVSRLTGSVAYKVSPSIELQGGMLSRHWGHGHRSVWWDRAASPMPQMSLLVDAGKVRYVQVIGSKRHWFEGSPPDILGLDVSALAPWQYAQRSRSWVAAHSVTADLGRGFQGTLFGAVTWLAQDSGYHRRFEPSYAVPFVAFRPSEYRLGSADNALAGLEGAWRSPNGQWLMSSQWLVDEWTTKEVFGGTNWWANKWGSTHTIQWQKGNYSVLIERCAVRPFTYSHAAVETSWTHDRSPIGHPMGANFEEWRVRLQGSWRAVRLRWAMTHLLQGVDDVDAALNGGRSIISMSSPHAMSSVGTSPLLPYTLRPEDYGIEGLYAGTEATPIAGIVESYRLFCDVDFAHQRMGFGRLFLRAAVRRSVERGMVSAEPIWWSRLEFGLRVRPPSEERDW